MRRGLEQATAVALVLFLVFAILLLGLGAEIWSGLRNGLDIQCALSSSLRSLGGKISMQNAFSLSCPRRFLDVGKDTVKLSYFEWGKVKAGGTYAYLFTAKDTKGDIHLQSKTALDSKSFATDFSRLASYEMQQCWKGFGSGKYDVTGSTSIFSGNACVICSEIYLDKTSGAPTTTVNLLNDLNTMHVPFADSAGTMGAQTYMQYLYDPSNPSDPTTCLSKDDIDKQMGAIPIASGKDYAVVLYRNGGKLQSAVGAPGKLVGAGNPYCQAVATIPIEQVFQDCDAVLN